MLTVILSVLGLIIGAAVAEEEGVVLGLFIGLAFGMILSLKGRVAELEQALVKMKKATKVPVTSQPKPERKPSLARAPEQTESTNKVMQVEKSDYVDIIEALRFDELTQTESVAPVQKKIVDTAPVNSEEYFAEKIVSKVKSFFTTGNVVVKVGAIVLFFGVAFLLKYAAERDMFPIELRLLAVVAFGIAMLVIGWRLRNEKLEYGLVLQGVGIGLLYLTVFAASKFYHVLPISSSLIIMYSL